MRRRVRLATLLMFTAAPVVPVSGQTRVVVRDAGPGEPGRVLLAALSAPHVLVTPGTDTAALRRDSTYRRSVIVLGRHATVDGTVNGDVIVVAGDLVIHPGARIGGRAIAIGGGVYNSTLATIAGGRTAYRDETFDITPVEGGYALDYRALAERTARRFSLPFLYGLRLPTYDRVNGLSVSFGPLVSLDTGDLEIEPIVAYRTHLGTIDPALRVTAQRGRRNRFESYAGRATFSNDRWIHGDIINSVNSLVTGLDTRNYYRADRVEATGHRLWERVTGQVEPFLGARWERSWSVGSPTVPSSVPWSLFGRRDASRMSRPNPAVSGGRITSLLGGVRADWELAGVVAAAMLGVEGAIDAPQDGRFVQGTIDGRVTFPTFGTQSFQVETHVVLTAGGGETPSQRYVGFGGSGTISTMETLEQRGDQLLFVDSRYHIPLARPRLPLVGAPVITLRHVIGSAGVGSLPDLEQNIALRVTLAILRFEVVLDPARDIVKTGFALSFSR
ncbi:MAG: hypothetical protein M3303_02445 [Gemmatimonadota bacterium]|nr:hypothetical protein [Gemmatimonadota bacterium]